MFLHQRFKGHESQKLQLNPQLDQKIQKTQQFYQQNFGSGWNLVPFSHHMAHKFWGWYEMLLLLLFDTNNGLFLHILQLVLRTHVVEEKTAKTRSLDKSINKCKLEIQIRWQIHILAKKRVKLEANLSYLSAKWASPTMCWCSSIAIVFIPDLERPNNRSFTTSIMYHNTCDGHGGKTKIL